MSRDEGLVLSGIDNLFCFVSNIYFGYVSRNIYPNMKLRFNHINISRIELVELLFHRYRR